MKKLTFKIVAIFAAWLGVGVIVPFISSETGWGPDVAATPSGAYSPVAVGDGPAGIPQRAYQAYVNAARHPINTCGVVWHDLAGIGKVESQHGLGYKSQILEDGMVVKIADPSKPGVLGPALNGSGVGGNITPMRAPAEASQWGITGGWDRAVGPMQHLSKEFSRNKVDGDGDGKFNPHDYDDATATAVNHLCADKKYSQPTCTGPERECPRRKAIRRYNGSGSNAIKYARDVLRLSAQYQSAGPGVVLPQTVQMSGPVPSQGGSAAANWWTQLGQQWGDYGLPATVTGRWVGFVMPVGSGGMVPGIGNVVAGEWASGKSIAKGRPDSNNCISGYRAAADDMFCTPLGTAHPAMAVSIAKAIRHWLKTDGADGNRIGQWRSAAVPGSKGGRAQKSYHKTGMGIDVGITAAGSSRRMDKLQAILCKYSAQNLGWNACSGSGEFSTGSKTSVFAQLIWRSVPGSRTKGHNDHIHLSVGADADPATVSRMIAELGGEGPVDSWAPYLQYTDSYGGIHEPRHIG